MARTIQEIKKSMTDAYISNPVVREKYGLREPDTFESSFSAVSIESVLFFIVASCCHILEVLFDKHCTEVNEIVNRGVVGSVAWYHKMALNFQYGDALVFDSNTCQFVYPRVDCTKNIVKYVAVRDRGTSVQILVSGEKGGNPEPLSNAVRTAFEEYMNRIKIAGIVIAIRSLPADYIQIEATIKVDPLTYNKDGTRITDGKKIIENAINDYLKNIVYGGTFNKTKLVDAIQAVPGVIDIELGMCSYSSDSGNHYQEIFGNNYTSAGGSFISSGLNNTLHYVV